MDTNSNKYTFMYAAIMVIIAAAILSSAAIVLKKPQQKNVEIEKKSNILTSVNKGLDAANAADKNAYIEAEYEKYITESYIVNAAGERIEGDAFTIDLNKELAEADANKRLPVFVCHDDDGSVKYVLPVRGKGLWGPIWGYIALESDMNTIFGANFDHKGETPGLGAEINQKFFQEPFKGEKLFDETGKFVSIQVVKGGAKPDDLHAVDAISGGTITSKGLEAMLKDNLSLYENFLKNQNK
ncbi:MAG: NADH:ubiquinone reductase (Na(+)-transporting) subunit C [Salinivirgaceae bacterium]